MRWWEIVLIVIFVAVPLLVGIYAIVAQPENPLKETIYLIGK